jgi:hypothetical protein
MQSCLCERPPKPDRLVRRRVPDETSSHRIVHSNYATADDGDGLLSTVVAYQAPGASDVQGSIISYETRIEFAPDTPRFMALDKTPIMANTRSEYETSWSTKRVLALVHAELGCLVEDVVHLRQGRGQIRQICAQVSAPEESTSYDAVVTVICSDPLGLFALHLVLTDEVHTIVPKIKSMEELEMLPKAMLEQVALLGTSSLCVEVADVV